MFPSLQQIASSVVFEIEKLYKAFLTKKAKYRQILASKTLPIGVYSGIGVYASGRNDQLGESWVSFYTAYGGQNKFIQNSKPKVNSIQQEINFCNSKEDLDKVTSNLQTSVFQAFKRSCKTKKVKKNFKTNWWTQDFDIKKKEHRALQRRASKTSGTQQLNYQQKFANKKACFKNLSLRAKGSTFSDFCTKTTDPYGTPYKSFIKDNIHPTELFKILGQPEKGDHKEMALNILKELYPQELIPFSRQPTFHLHIEKPFTQNELKRILQKFPTKKAPGYDAIDFVILKSIFKHFLKLLLSFYNKCLNLQCFPTPLKVGIIVLFHKKGKPKSETKSYRPVSLLPTLSKILEKLLLERLNFHLRTNNLATGSCPVFPGIGPPLHLKATKASQFYTRKFLLNITGAYSTTPTAALHVIGTTITPLHTKAQMESILARPNPPLIIHPANFDLEDRVSIVSEPHPPSDAIYTGGSHLEGERGCAFCVIQKNVQIHQWTAKLSPHNTVFQAETLAIEEAINWANSKGISTSIWGDSESALRAISSFKSSNPLIQETEQALLQNSSMQLNWIKAHVGFLGNEAANNIAKQEETHLHLQAPKCHLKKMLLNLSLSINGNKIGFQATLEEQFLI
ncbi:hypothetical protein AVEN_182145-1 [Araneus ventricosus]|uniref:RNase H type-1 domain-containing protein n=1 Tax=Araneus ventricosus TaxID=182803 RepID=A0A4Y2GNQ4_ARAVE|nr:hypothetical protein AVEN_182145-1 [Araneus ventricosus]